MEHLDRFIIADDVELQDETEQWAVAGIEGPASLACASEIGIPVPEEAFGVAKWQSGFVTRVAMTGPMGLRVFVPASDFPPLLERFEKAGIPLASAAEAESVRVENGVPRYGSDISERHLVQETGLLHGVHQNKGCYVGQEIVERVRTQAQIHRRLRRLRIDGDETPVPGSKLLLQGKEVGDVTSAAFSPALRSVFALGYVRTEAVEVALEVAGTAMVARVL
jgi:folate-binding protein YgfZ